jgi:hypothetical protein
MPSDPGTAAQRDAGLRRVSRLTRWLLAGALALTAGFSAIAARGFSGSTGQTGGTATTGASGQTSNSDSSDSGSDSSDDGSALQAPSNSPSASGGPGSVTSGGS